MGGWLNEGQYRVLTEELNSGKVNFGCVSLVFVRDEKLTGVYCLTWENSNCREIFTWQRTPAVPEPSCAVRCTARPWINQRWQRSDTQPSQARGLFYQNAGEAPKAIQKAPSVTENTDVGLISGFRSDCGARLTSSSDPKRKFPKNIRNLSWSYRNALIPYWPLSHHVSVTRGKYLQIDENY